MLRQNRTAMKTQLLTKRIGQKRFMSRRARCLCRCAKERVRGAFGCQILIPKSNALEVPYAVGGSMFIN